MNKIVLIGNLTHDPETRSTPNGVTVCSFTIAVNRRFASQGGEKQTDFFRINAWRQLGDLCARYLTKGRKVAVIGELSLDVSADEVEFLSPKGQEDGSANYSAPRPQQSHGSSQDMAGFNDISSDDIPF